MPRFFVAASNLFGGAAVIRGEDVRHIRALRIRRGEVFTICDGSGRDFTCRLGDKTDGGYAFEILSESPSITEPTVEVSVFLGLPKQLERLEFAVQKCVELGAAELIVFTSSRTVAKTDAAGLVKKLLRLNKISEEAAKQSGRGKIPGVRAVTSFEAAIREAAAAELPLFFYEEAPRGYGVSAAVQTKPEAATFSVVTGPEGGFSPEEAALAESAGLLTVSLGPRILRCETAPMAALAALLLLTGNLGN
jgi:16S rRNA (uracil1498-N3)-methyltransferase